MAFYEPLHELLKDMTLERIRAESPSDWDSHHPDGPPYFEEFTPFVRRRGIAGYHRSFAFDRFFLAKNERERRLHAYLSSLVDLAHRAQKIAVLKFCRSHGRAAWMRTNFPSALHLAVLRDPIAQWNSAWRQAKGGNAYFLAAPLAILSRNLADPMVSLCVNRLGLELGGLRRRSFERTYEQCVRLVNTSSTTALYRSYLAFWLLSACKAVPHVDATIDVDALSESAVYRKNIQEMLLATIGFTADFGNARTPASKGSGHDLRAGEIRRAYADAMLALAAVAAGDGAVDDAAETIARKLDVRFSTIGVIDPERSTQLLFLDT
jgi:hypothetical protein